MNAWVRSLGTVVACLLLLAVGSRSASSVSNERDRHTMDALLTTPMDSSTILFAKWIGNIFSVRWGWMWLGSIYLLGLLGGGLEPLALVLLLLAWFVYAAVVSMLGLWFSIVSRTTLRATLWTLLATTGAGVGHWLLWVCCIPLMISMRSEPKLMEWVRNIQIGITPPAALSYAFAFYRGDFDQYDHGGIGFHWRAVGFAVFGLFFWAAVTGFLWTAASARFRVVTGRQPLQRREIRRKAI